MSHCGSAASARWWQKRRWLRCRIIELGTVGVLADDAVYQAEGEWRLRKQHRRS